MTARGQEPTNAIQTYQRELRDNIVQALKTLLEARHLYQSVTVEFPEQAAVLSNVDPDLRHVAATAIGTLYRSAWVFKQNSTAPTDKRLAGVVVLVPDVKLYCSRCTRVEAFNFQETSLIVPPTAVLGKQVQVLAMTFLCQSCKMIPEAFLIRVEGSRLTLSGRTPIEHVDVPAVIPKQLRPWYTSAVVAHQSGQTLAANFLLRTLIEQWARSQVETHHDRADALMDAYMAPLPRDFKERFPSMRDLYDQLSADMHAAAGSAELFEQSAAKVIRHFDARRLFELAEKPVKM